MPNSESLCPAHTAAVLLVSYTVHDVIDKRRCSIGLDTRRVWYLNGDAHPGTGHVILHLNKVYMEHVPCSRQFDRMLCMTNLCVTDALRILCTTRIDVESEVIKDPRRCWVKLSVLLGWADPSLVANIWRILW